tara:strand:+ start:626 stop:997 length:372 start_codon:yes stop_codon:yes gene_type:complete
MNQEKTAVTMATICIEDLEVSTTIGINPEELDIPQTIFITIKFDININKVSKTDKIIDTVDYDNLSKTVNTLTKESKSKLLETLVVELNDKLTDLYPIKNLDLIIKKPAALNNAKNVSIQLNK